MQDAGIPEESSVADVRVSRMVEDIVGCKWSLAVLGAVRNGVTRPGELGRAIQGISTKVLNERLNKMMRYGILAKKVFPEVPPRVEYSFTDFGRKLLSVLDRIEELEGELVAERERRIRQSAREGDPE